MMDSCSVQAMCGGHQQFFFHLFLTCPQLEFYKREAMWGRPSFPFILAFLGLHFLSFCPLGFQFLFFCLLGLDFLSFWLLGTGWICEHLCTRRVSLRYRYGYRFGTGENVEKKEQFQALHANMNELYNCISRYYKGDRFW